MTRDRDQNMQRTRATYDDIGAEYQAANTEIPESVVASLDSFQAALPPGAVVADIGCGPGRDLGEMRRRGIVCVGFDLSFGMLRAATAVPSPSTGEVMPGVVAVADMSVLPVRSACLQGIWCAASMLHLPRDRTDSTLGGFADALGPGGVLHLSIAEGSREGMERARYGDGEPLWLVERTEDEITTALEAAGFEVLSIARSASHRRWLTLLCRKGTRIG